MPKRTPAWPIARRASAKEGASIPSDFGTRSSRTRQKSRRVPDRRFAASGMTNFCSHSDAGRNFSICRHFNQSSFRRKPEPSDFGTQSSRACQKSRRVPDRRSAASGMTNFCCHSDAGRNFSICRHFNQSSFRRKPEPSDFGTQSSRTRQKSRRVPDRRFAASGMTNFYCHSDAGRNPSLLRPPGVTS